MFFFNSRFIFIVLFIGLITPGYSYFIDGASGARPAGMGDAFVSLADDANTVMYNPAGLSNLDQIEFNGMYTDLYSGLNAMLYTGQPGGLGYHFLSLALPVNKKSGTVGCSWITFHSAFYKEQMLYFSYGKAFDSLAVLGNQIRLGTGLNIKVLNWSVPYGDYSEAVQKTGLTADVGLLATVNSFFTVGLAGENVIPVSMNLEGPSEVVPILWRLGATCSFLKLSRYVNEINVTGEITLRNQIVVPKLGAEAWFGGQLALRAGVNRDLISSGLSYRINNVSDSPFVMQLDYAFSYPFYIEKSWGSHRLGLDVRWDDHYLETKKQDEAKQIQIVVQKLLDIEGSMMMAQKAVRNLEGVNAAMVSIHQINKSRAIITALFQLVVLVEKTAHELESELAKLQFSASSIRNQAPLKWDLSIEDESNLEALTQRMSTIQKNIKNVMVEISSGKKVIQKTTGKKFEVFQVTKPLEQLVAMNKKRLILLQHEKNKLEAAVAGIEMHLAMLQKRIKEIAATKNEATHYNRTIEAHLNTMQLVIGNLKTYGLAEYASQLQRLQLHKQQFQQAGQFAVNRDQRIIVGCERQWLSNIGEYSQSVKWLKAAQVYLLKASNVQVVYRYYSNQKDLESDFQKGKIDLLLTKRSLRNRLEKEKKAYPIATYRRDNKKTYRECIIVRKKDQLSHVKQLKGKIVGYLSQESLDQLQSGFFDNQHDEINGVGFKDKIHIQTIVGAVLALQLKEIDAIVGGEDILQVQGNYKERFNDELHILSFSTLPEKSNVALMVRSFLNQRKQKKLMQLMTQLFLMHTTDEGRDLLSEIKVEKFESY